MPSQKPESCTHRTKLGRNVVRLRQASGLTQEQLAEKIGVSTRYLQSIEAGEYFPALPNLSKVRKALGSSWDELFKGC